MSEAARTTTCPVCGERCRVTVEDVLYRHPRNALTPCPGTGMLVEVERPQAVRPMGESTHVREKMRALLSEAESGGMGLGARLDAAMEIVTEVWDAGFNHRDDIDPYGHGMLPEDNPHRVTEGSES